MPQQIGGSGALGGLGITTIPQGTLAEIKEAGLDPANVACCHAVIRGVVRGCAVHRECPFNVQRLGGFKDTGGPRYVGYFLQTHEGNKKEDFCSCFTFVRTMLARMYAGIAARQQGKAQYEIIRIIAQEGEKISIREGRPVNELDKSPTAAYVYHREMRTIPSYPRPSSNDKVDYEQELADRESRRAQLEEEFEYQAYLASRRVTQDDGREEEDTPFEVDEFAGQAAVTAEPAVGGDRDDD